MADLEKEVEALQAEITSLKDSDTPSMRTAAYVEPASAPVSAPSPAPADKISLSSLLGPVTVSGFGDVYYGYDYNHPENNQSGLRAFEAPTNGFAFNMAELILDKPADATSAESRLGYHVSAGYGQAAKVVNGSDTVFAGYEPDGFYVKEAYADYLAPIGKGLTITVGKFVTPIGAEVIESNANWNYSRSLLFYYAIPYFHFGASAKYAFNPKIAVTGYLVNGWNNTVIDHYYNTGLSSGLTYGVSLAYTPNAKWSATENYFAGPVVDAYNYVHTAYPVTDWKQLSDTVIGYTPNAKWAFQVNGDYGFGPRYYTYTDESGAPTGGPAVNWWGFAGYAKYTWTPKTNFAVRYEYYDDTNGYTGLISGGPDSGDRGFAQEVTGTWSYNLTSALLVRAEYRYDYATQPIFPKSTDGYVREQNTAYLSFVYSFSSANLK